MQFKQYMENQMPNMTTAFHCGTVFEGPFDTNTQGSGEGSQALGPGIYFSSSEEKAKTYCKYTDQSQMYQVQFPTTNLYNIQEESPDQLRNAIDLIVKQLGYASDLEMPMGDFGQHGAGAIGSIVKAIGNDKARQLFVANGIDGAYENLGSVIEYSIYNPQIINIVNTNDT